jgi:hypothetical protein
VETHKQDDHMESFFLAETVSIPTANAAANFTFDDMMLVCLQCFWQWDCVGHAVWNSGSIRP